MRHGVDGWDLVEYEWDPKTGLGHYLYEREVNGSIVNTRLVKPQPVNETHIGWYMRPVESFALAM